MAFSCWALKQTGEYILFPRTMRFSSTYTGISSNAWVRVREVVGIVDGDGWCGFSFSLSLNESLLLSDINSFDLIWSILPIGAFTTDRGGETRLRGKEYTSIQ